MTHSEGVIKFDLKFHFAPLPSETDVADIHAWRQKLYAAGLIGLDPHRYEGYGFGNISCRLPPFNAPRQHRRFLITGTQTGGLNVLTPEHYVEVTSYDPSHNRLVAKGPIEPSSEALTHGILYDLDDSLRWVMHVHSPEIWARAADLKLPITDPSATYGTPQMAFAVELLFMSSVLKTHPLFVMGGHEDGVVSFGRTADEAGTILFQTLKKAKS